MNSKIIHSVDFYLNSDGSVEMKYWIFTISNYGIFGMAFEWRETNMREI